MNNILEFLEAVAVRLPDKTAVIDETGACCWRQLLQSSQSAGTALAARVPPRTPVPVLIEKGRHALSVFFGAVQAGCFYVPLNPALPEARLRQVLDVLDAPVIVTDRTNRPLAARLFPASDVMLAEELIRTPSNLTALARIRAGMADTDPLYCLFTSGSTGTPKGVVISHRSVLSFIPAFVRLSGIGADDASATRLPFDFDVSVWRHLRRPVYRRSAGRYPPAAVFPARGADGLPLRAPRHVPDLGCVRAVPGQRAARVDTHAGHRAPRAVQRRGHAARAPAPLDAGPRLPRGISSTCTWPYRNHLQLYFTIDRERKRVAGVLPLGNAFPNARVFLLDGKGQEVTRPDEVGEICVGGAGLALGYYNAPEQTAQAFVQHPCNQRYMERIYRTGDLGRYDAQGRLYFCGRRDFQIKHMGHRIELEEIERAAAALPGAEQCCCVFDERKSRLHAFYTGTAESAALYEQLSRQLPVFMLPRTLERLEHMPLTANGKADRRRLLAIARRETT